MVKFDFTGKKVLLTGASGGIGKVIAKKFIEAGAEIVLSGTSEEKLANTKSELNGDDKVHTIATNLSSMENAAQLVKDANSKMEGLDVVICNAGVTKDGLAIAMKDDAFQDVIDINLSAPFAMAREGIKIMSKRGGGRVINIASISGLKGVAGQANYSAAKAGLINLTRTLAKESARRKVTVNAVCPGFTQTPMIDKLPDAAKEAILKDIPMSRVADPLEIANPVLFLASEGASYITGSTVVADGGLTA